MFKRYFCSMSKFKVLITHPDVPSSGLEILKPRCELLFMKNLNQEEFNSYAGEVDGIFLFGGWKIGKDFIEKSNGRLKVVGNMGVGVDHLDINFLKSVNVKVSNTPGTLEDSVAEVALGLALSVGHRMKEGFDKILKGEWKKSEPQWLLGHEISNSTFGILGLGDTGRAIASRVMAFKPKRILYTSRTPKSYDKEFGAEFVDLDYFLKESDFITISCPLTPETRNIINKSTICKMKENAIIINVARGGIVNQDDLYDALKSNRIMGAGLDVMTPEPIDKSHPLLELTNCILTPHIGSATYKARCAMSELAGQNILAALENRKMPSPL